MELCVVGDVKVDTISLASIHRDSLRIHYVQNTKQLHEAQKVRHRVYVEEMGFEPPSPNRREVDQWDSHSLTCIAEHKSTGRIVGCIRVVDNASCKNRLPLPFEKYCLPEFADLETIQKQHLVGRYGEISRLAVLPEFRSKPGCTQQRAAMQGATNLSCLPSADEQCHKVIALSLYLSSIALVDLHGMNMVLVMMERKLNRHLRLCGIKFSQLSDYIEYHGPRALFGRSPTELVKAFGSEVQELYAQIRSDLSNQLVDNEQLTHVA